MFAKTPIPIRNNAAQKPMPEILTNAVIERLVGHTNIVYYNCEKNAWNTDKYNGYMIGDQGIDTQNIRKFKAVMDAIPEFSAQYEFAASVTMTIDGASFPGWVKLINNPQYSKIGRTVVGNIIVRNKKTGIHELYGNSWVNVHNYNNPNVAVYDGASMFALCGIGDPVFRAALIAAHTR